MPLFFFWLSCFLDAYGVNDAHCGNDAHCVNDAHDVNASPAIGFVDCDRDSNRLLFFKSSPETLINILVKTLFTTTSC